MSGFADCLTARRQCFAAVLAVLLSLTAGAQAQEPEVSEDSTRDPREEVVVSATRIPTTWERVPMAVGTWLVLGWMLLKVVA